MPSYSVSLQPVGPYLIETGGVLTVSSSTALSAEYSLTLTGTRLPVPFLGGTTAYANQAMYLWFYTTTGTVTVTIDNTPSNALRQSIEPDWRTVDTPPLQNDAYNNNRTNTSKLRIALAKVLAGTGTCKIGFIGDSTTMGAFATTDAVAYTGNRTKSYPYFTAARLTGLGIPARTDSIFGNNAAGTTTAALTTYDSRIVFGNSWSIPGSPNGLGDRYFLSTTTTNDIAFTPVSAFDTIDVYYAQASGAGTFTVNVDGGATLATQATSGSSQYRKLTITGVTLATHTINIRVSVAGIGVYINGIAVRDSTTPRVEIYNWGWSGSTSMNWADPATADPAFGPAASMAVVAPDCTFINLAINDPRQVVANTLAQYTSNIQRLITAAKLSGDCVLMTGNVTSLGNEGNVGPYIDALYGLAATNNIPLIDTFKKWSPYSSVASSGYYIETGTVIHPGAAGYMDMAASVVKLITTA